MYFSTSGNNGYRYATVVRHQGAAITFAWDKDAQAIFYRVLTTEPGQPDDERNWSAPDKLRFPRQIRPAGMGLITADVTGTKYDPSVVVDAPFSVVSDGTHVYVFRASGHNTLLVDRFVYDTARRGLNPNLEARFQRSRKRDVPASRKDTLGPRSMDGEAFVEPTTELRLTDESGAPLGTKDASGAQIAPHVTVMLLPTALQGRSRWQFFAVGGAKSLLGISIRRGLDGLFALDDREVDGETDYAVRYQRYDLKIAGDLDATLAPGATLYAQQEELADEYGRLRPMKRQQRVMVAFPTVKDKAPAALALLDAALTPDGMLAAITSAGGLTPLAITSDAAQGQTPMGASGFDARGLAVTVAELAFAKAASAPYLLDSADGLVHLYYRSAANALEVAQYDPAVRRAVFALALEDGSATGAPCLLLAARQAGAHANQATITLERGSRPQTLTLTIAEGKRQETLKDLPMSVGAFVKAINAGFTADDGQAQPASKLFAAAMSVPGIEERSIAAPVESRKATQAIMGVSGVWRAESPGKALTFDGKDDQVDVSLAGTTPLTGSVTLEAWVRLAEDQAQDSAILSYHHGPEARLAFGLREVLQAPAGKTSHSGLRNRFALYFDGVDDFVGIGSPAKLTMTAQSRFTIEAWIAPEATDGWRNIVAKGYNASVDDNSTGEIVLRINNGVYEFGCWRRAGNDSLNTQAAFRVPSEDIGAWVHLAGTYDGTQWLLFRNGVQVASKIGEGPRDFQADWSIGAQGFGRERFFKGMIGDVRIWSVALGTSELTQTMGRRNSTWSEGWSNPSLIGCWGCESARVVNDYSKDSAPGYGGGFSNSTNEAAIPTLRLRPDLRYGLYAGAAQVAGGAGVAVASKSLALKPNSWHHVAAVYRASHALRFDGKAGVACGADVSLDAPDAATVEAWVTRERAAAETLAARWGAQEDKQRWKLHLDKDGHPCFTVRALDAEGAGELVTVRGPQALPVGEARHLAATFDGAERNAYVLDLNGDDNGIGYAGITSAHGFNFDHDEPFTVEFWLKAPREQPFAGDLGELPIIHYRYDNTDTYKTRDTFPFGLYLGNTDATRGRIIARRGDGVNLPLVTSSTRIDDGLFHHIAFVKSGKELRLLIDGVPEATALDTTTATTKNVLSAIELGTFGPANHKVRRLRGQLYGLRIWNLARSAAQLNAAMHSQSASEAGLVGAWTPSVAHTFGGDIQNPVGNAPLTMPERRIVSEVDVATRSAALYLDGALVARRPLTVEQAVTTITGGVAAGDDHIAVTYANGKALMGHEGQLIRVNDELMLILGVEDKAISYRVRVVRGVYGTSAASHSGMPSVYLLKRESRSLDVGGAPLTMGRESDGGERFQGTLDNVRLWNTARARGQIAGGRFDPPAADATGLLGDWRFEERAGNVAAANKGENHGRLLHDDPDQIEAMWRTAESGARWTLYVDGQPVETTPVASTTFGGYGSAGSCTLGAAAGAMRFGGSMDELRVWSQARTAEQIRDNMFRPQPDGEPGLAAYWPLNAAQGGKVADLAGGGHTATLSGPELVASGVPLGGEGRAVVHAYGGQSYAEFAVTIGGAPCAVEYGDLQYDDAGELLGVMKRCYVYATSGGLTIDSGVKVGDLEVEFVGQVQTAPTLVGFIEGPPPVPSENLTVNNAQVDDYVNTATIELVESSESTQVYSAERDTGFDMAVSGKAGLYIKAEAETGVAFITNLFSAEMKLGAQFKFEHSLGWLNGGSVSATTSRTITNTLGVAGSWEPERTGEGVTPFLNMTVGQRYLPVNLGYALVKSATADLYALRLRRTGALVAYNIVPNPDIPEDWNVIMFPLDPTYVRNGTLDGKVGTEWDEHYGERGSYFKPIEAYALKERIEREARKQDAYYASGKFDAGALGRSTATGRGGRASELPDQELGYDWEARAPRRSLCNTYVWTADGGFYAEEEEFSSVREESLGGSYSFLGQAGFYADIAVAGGGVGVFLEMDALFGGHINVTVTKRKEEAVGFGLKVSVAADGFLNHWEGDPQKLSGCYLNRPSPGKVDAYRFMSFYLARSYENFEAFTSKVVDSNWLNGTGDYAGKRYPNAEALRQAMARPNEVWRVLHRVTYVSRIADEETPTLKVARPSNLELNMLLLRRLADKVARDPDYQGRASLTQSIRKAVDTLVNTELKGEMWLEALKKVADDATNVKQQQRALAALAELKADIVAYTRAAYEVGDLAYPPDPQPLGGASLLLGDGQTAATALEPVNLAVWAPAERQRPVSAQPRAFSEEQQGSLLTPEPMRRVRIGLEALYTFAEGQGKLVRDLARQGAALDLVAGDQSKLSWNGGLRLDGPALLATTIPATRLSEAVRSNKELTVELWITPQAAGPEPRPIILLGAGAQGERNFTLSQAGERYLAQLRTSATSSTGADQAFGAAAGAPDALTHVVFTRDAAGAATLYIDGVETSRRTISGDLAAWNPDLKLYLGGNGAGRHWEGELHLAAFYSRALRPAEVQHNFACGAQINLPPVVEAGVDQLVSRVLGATLSGSVADELRPVAELKLRWSLVDGPGEPVFANPAQLTTTVTFPIAGVYTLRLSADDGVSISADEVMVTVIDNQAPQASIVAPARAPVGEAVLLEAVVSDDGLPADPGRLTMTWEALGPVELDASSGEYTRATFKQLGHHTVRLQVSDGHLTTVCEVRVEVFDPHLQARFTFAEAPGAAITSVEGMQQGLALSVPNAQALAWSPGALKVTSPTYLATQAAPGGLIEALAATGALTIEAWITPERIELPGDRHGPARIVTLSADAQTGYFALGQLGSQYVVRVRTEQTNTNGSDGKELTCGVVTPGKRTHIVYTRDAQGKVAFYQDGVALNLNGYKLAGKLNWTASGAPIYRLALANEYHNSGEAAKARPWLGTYHLVTLFSRVLTSAEVQAAYEAGKD